MQEEERKGELLNPEASDVNYINVKQVLISQLGVLFISITPL